MPSGTPESVFFPDCGMFPCFQEPSRSRSAGAAGKDLQGFTSVLQRGSTKNPARNLLAEQTPDRMKTSIFFLWVHFLEQARWNLRSLRDGVLYPHPTRRRAAVLGSRQSPPLHSLEPHGTQWHLSAQLPVPWDTHQLWGPWKKKIKTL